MMSKEQREAILKCPCVVCYLLNLEQTSHTEGHHMKHLPDGTRLARGQKKASDDFMLPLCQKTHHWNGVFAVMSLNEFEKLAGDEPYLWQVTHQELLPIYGDV